MKLIRGTAVNTPASPTDDEQTLLEEMFCDHVIVQTPVTVNDNSRYVKSVYFPKSEIITEDDMGSIGYCLRQANYGHKDNKAPSDAVLISPHAFIQECEERGLKHLAKIMFPDAYWNYYRPKGYSQMVDYEKFTEPPSDCLCESGEVDSASKCPCDECVEATRRFDEAWGIK